MEVFPGALGILEGWTGGLMGKFSSRAPFEVLKNEPLIGALLPRPFGGIVLSKNTKNQATKDWNSIRYKTIHSNSLLWENLTQKLTSKNSGGITNLYTEEQRLPKQRSCDGKDTEIAIRKRTHQKGCR